MLQNKAQIYTRIPLPSVWEIGKRKGAPPPPPLGDYTLLEAVRHFRSVVLDVGSRVTTAHAHQCCIFQSYAKTVPSRMKLDYAWTSIHDNGHVVTACDVWLQQRISGWSGITACMYPTVYCENTSLEKNPAYANGAACTHFAPPQYLKILHLPLSFIASLVIIPFRVLLLWPSVRHHKRMKEHSSKLINSRSNSWENSCQFQHRRINCKFKPRGLVFAMTYKPSHSPTGNHLRCYYPRAKNG